MGFQHYSGPSNKFPGQNQWKSLETIFNLYKPEMLQTGNTGEDVGRIWNAVKECAKLGVDERVDERVIFCTIMQESSGHVGVKTTVNADGHGTAGLMQCDGSPGFPSQNGLSQDQITSMVRAGTNHFKANLSEHGNDYYCAMRAYNSGSVNVNDLSDGCGATPAYVSDMANRLLGRTPY